MNPTYIKSEPYPWPYNGDLRPQNTALIVIDMQTDFCGQGGYIDLLGYDIGLNQDRNPSLCSFFKLPAGQAGFPITAGPDGRVWFFVRDQGALYAAKMTTSGQIGRASCRERV